MDFLLATLKKLFLGAEEWSFLLEIVIRTLLMYIIVLVSLRVLGKRGVKQLSVFELVVIIGLGSAAGDPMFYKEVGIGAAVVVFTVVVFSYKVTSYFVNKNKKFEILLEGNCVCLIENGQFSIENFEKEDLAQDEFFAELRQKSVSHLGQVKLAIIETNGNISVFFVPDEHVNYGLPILPKLFEKKHNKISEEGNYSCSFCGYTQVITPANQIICPRCKKDKWIKSINTLRIS